jgi:uncharacterized protein
MKRVFIIHGYGGSPNKNWFPWLKSELEKLNVSVIVPAMPNTENPQLSEWLPYLQSQVGTADENTYFVGHSLGCIAILRYIESLPKNARVGGVVLVAGFISSIHFHELDNFFQTPLNDEKIKTSVKKIIAINSDNDPHVPYQQAEEIKNSLNSELIMIHNGEHLNGKAGYLTFPDLLKKVEEIL